ncbi:MAG: hypothetical protein V9H69_12230 [Anaerolineae bacterium]
MLALALAAAALLLGLLWWQIPHLARGVLLACQSAAEALHGYLPLAGLLLPLGLLLAAMLAGLGKLLSQLRFTQRLLDDLNRRGQPLPAGLAGLGCSPGSGRPRDLGRGSGGLRLCRWAGAAAHLAEQRSAGAAGRRRAGRGAAP